MTLFRRSQVGRDDDSGGAQGPCRSNARERGNDLPGDTGQILRADLQVLVVERAVVVRDGLGRLMPRLGGVLAVVEDRVPGGPEQGLVVEEEEVRIEDGGAVVAGAGCDRLPRAADLDPYLVERPGERFPLGLGVAR